MAKFGVRIPNFAAETKIVFYNEEKITFIYVNYAQHDDLRTVGNSYAF